MVKLLMAFFFSIALSQIAFGEIQDPRTVIDNNEAIEKLQVEEDVVAAYDRLISANAREPFSPEIHLNVGVVLMAQKNGEKAAKAFSQVLKMTENPALLFSAHFNLGLVYSEGEDTVERALDHYQRALKYNPFSKETKTNIELLVQQQQQQGKGEGEGDQKEENEDGKGDKEKEEPKKYKENKPQPKPFKSKKLSKQDVKKIFEELLQQEQKIREEFNKDKKSPKDSVREKDW